MHKRMYTIKIGFMVLVLLTMVVKPSMGGKQLSGRALIDELRQGGYVMYFRHAITDMTSGDNVQTGVDYTSCNRDDMRQLSDEGREQSRQIGEDIRRLEIPIGSIYSSEFCRAWETAQLLNLGPVVKIRALNSFKVEDMMGGRDAMIERARQEIGRYPEEGTNTILVAHGDLMRGATSDYTDEGGAAVYKPNGDGTFTLVAQIAPEDWAQMVDKFQPQGE